MAIPPVWRKDAGPPEVAAVCVTTPRPDISLEVRPDILVFFVTDPVDDATAGAVRRRLGGLGYFDDPAAEAPADRTTGGYVRVTGGAEVDALWQAAVRVSGELGVTVEIQWREQILGHLRHGTPDPGVEAAVRATLGSVHPA